MIEQQRVPADLAEIPPGPQLAAALAGIDLAGLSGFEAVEVLKARYRLLNHDRAQLMASMVEVGSRDIGPDGELPPRSEPDEFAADEIRAALVLTRRAAEAQFHLAWGLRSRLPAVPAAMDGGRLDEPRARIFFEWTTDLTQEQARAICDRLLPRCGELTTGQLIEAIKKLAIAIDPEWARRRYEEAVADRKVVGSRNPDGSANLSGINLPVDRVAEASARIEALAKAAKRAGHPDPVDHVRADLYLGMIDGSYAGLDDDSILGLLLADHTAAPQETATWESAADGAPDAAAPDAAAPDAAAPDAAAPDAGAAAGEPARAGRGSPAPRAPRDGRGGAKELRVRLSTLLGRDDCPGELAGWGPVHAELARDLAAAMGGAQWRYVVTGADGRAVRTGRMRGRPPGPGRSSSGDVVEVQLPVTLPAGLTRDSAACAPAGAWQWAVAELIGRHTSRDIVPGNDTDGVDGMDGAGQRVPGAALRRWLQVRDRCCVGPGCRAPARTADVDHTHDYADGGSTVEGNLEHTCRHDHRLKHEGGWELHQPEPGRFLWISRLGQAYAVHPPPIIEPLPDPMPAHRTSRSLGTPVADHDDPIMPPPTGSSRRPRPPPAHGTGDQPPAF